MINVVSFYTPDWEYPLYAKKLQEDCERLGLTHHIIEKPSRNDYVKNCNMKPFFVKEMLELLKNPILWIDVDGSIVSEPSLLLTEDVKKFDIAANRSQHHDSKIHVGSIWFNYTQPTLELIDAWCDVMINGGLDDGAFNHVWQKNSHKIKLYELPPEYFVILTHMGSPVPENSCIVHRLSRSSLKLDWKSRKVNLL